MDEINATTLARAVPWVLDTVENGTPLLVTRGREDGKPRPVAKIIPVDESEEHPEGLVGATREAPTDVDAAAADLDMARRIVAFLQEMIDLDPEAVSALIAARVPCSQALAGHPSVQVGTAAEVAKLQASEEGEPAGLPYRVGLLGFLNGLVGTATDGRGLVAVIMDDSGRALGARLLEDRL